MLLAHDDAPDAGPAPAVVLLHAGIADRRMWGPVAGHLARAFRVIAPDLRGHGETPLPDGDYVDADDVAALLDHLGVDDAAVVGSGYGGRVALELAASHPTRVRQLVLINPSHGTRSASIDAQGFNDVEDALLSAGDIEGAVRLNVTTFLGDDASLSTREALAGMQRQVFEHVFAAAGDADRRTVRRHRGQPVDVDLAKIAVPTLVITGANALRHFQDVAQDIVAAVPGAERVQLPWAAMLPSLERPDVVVSLLLDALRDDPDVHAP